MNMQAFQEMADELADVEEVLLQLQKPHGPQSDQWQLVEAMRGLTWVVHLLAKEMRKEGRK